MSEGWSTRFKRDDLVEYVGPELEDWSEPRHGERGTVVSIDPPSSWVVAWERTTSVHPEAWLRSVDGSESPSVSWRPSTRFKEGDLVEYVGPQLKDPYEPRYGERGTLIDFDPPDSWAVSWERITIVVPESCLRHVDAPEAPPSG
jgi:hypothetical protein